MSEVAVSISIQGDPRYFWAGRQSALSVLKHTDFDLFISTDNEKAVALKAGNRVRYLPIHSTFQSDFRAKPFLQKLQGLARAAEAGAHQYVVSLDADAVLVRPVMRETVEGALGEKGLGMVEQPGILGSDIGRAGLFDHFVSHTVRWFDGDAGGIRPADFRFFNSGVVLARVGCLEEMLGWASGCLKRLPERHQVGGHMIGDQDYFQYWTHLVSPGSCAVLPWYWNHCRHWDEGFPRPEALILHFSLFCQAPSWRQILQMALFARNWNTLGRVFSFLGRDY